MERIYCISQSGVMEHHTSRSLCTLLAETAAGQDEGDSDRPERLPQGHLWPQHAVMSHVYCTGTSERRDFTKLNSYSSCVFSLFQIAKTTSESISKWLCQYYKCQCQCCQYLQSNCQIGKLSIVDPQLSNVMLNCLSSIVNLSDCQYVRFSICQILKLSNVEN